MKKLTITVEADSIEQLEKQLNRGIDHLSDVLKERGFNNLNLKGAFVTKEDEVINLYSITLNNIE